MPSSAVHPFLPSAFHDDGTLDPDGQTALAATTAGAGVDGIAVLGLTSGEVSLLRPDEVGTVVAAARRGSAGLPVAAGTGPPGPGVLTIARHAAQAGADALVVSVPAGEAATASLGAVAALGLPLWLHHHPAVTGAALDVPALAGLASELDAVALVIEAAPPGDVLAPLAKALPDRGRLGGLAALFLPEEAEAGATGTVAGTVVPERLVEVVRRLDGTTADAAFDTYLELLPWLRLEAGNPGLRVRKEAWRQRGVLGSARVRRGKPLGTATKVAITRRLRQVGVEVTTPYPGSAGPEDT
jgi:4-hydroxy-tetrahydrodipicolinate synthase